MTSRGSPTFRKRRLGRRLRLLRQSAGLTLDEAAPKLDKTRSSLHRVETGETRADVHLIRSMMDLYDCFEDDLLDMSRLAAKNGWWRQYGIEDMGYVDAETEATDVLEFSGLNVPGLLQTEAYTRAQLSAGAPRSPQRLENDVQVRLIRQQRLTEEQHPLRLSAIVDEAALHREVGGPAVMAEQARHLASAAELPTVTLQLLPFTAGAHDAMVGSFIVLEFEQPEPDLLYISHVVGGMHLDNSERVREAKMVFDRLHTQALSRSDSVKRLERLADDLSS